MLLRRRLALLLVLTAPVLAGCSGDDENEAATTATTAPAVTETTEAIRTPDEVKIAVFERSYSECGSFSIPRLAAKYKVPRRPASIASAVGRAWTDQFNASADAVQSGRDGCLQALREAG